MRGMEREAVMHRVWIGVLVLALCLAALPATAAPAGDAAPSWGRQVVDRVVGFVTGLFGDDEITWPVVDLSGSPEATNTTTATADPPPNQGGEGGPDWDPNG